eukprot:2722600-Rhodomonas_salina.1
MPGTETAVVPCEAVGSMEGFEPGKPLPTEQANGQVNLPPSPNFLGGRSAAISCGSAAMNR